MDSVKAGGVSDTLHYAVPAPETAQLHAEVERARVVFAEHLAELVGAEVDLTRLVLTGNLYFGVIRVEGVALLDGSAQPHPWWKLDPRRDRWFPNKRTKKGKAAVEALGTLAIPHLVYALEDLGVPTYWADPDAERGYFAGISKADGMYLLSYPRAHLPPDPIPGWLLPLSPEEYARLMAEKGEAL